MAPANSHNSGSGAAPRTRHFGAVELTVFASLWMTIAWIGMDMYLPALPSLDETFPVTSALINATLFSYQVAMAVGSLVGGPISDRDGRKRVTVIGGVLLFAFSLVCSQAHTIGLLIIARVFAGFGGGILCATTMAIVKDRLSGAELDRAVAVTQSLVAIGPIVAPAMGSLVLNAIGWRGIFLLLAALSLICLVWTVSMAESLPAEKRADIGVVRSLGLIAHVARNRSFTMLLIALSFPAFSFGAYMTLGSYIFVDFFSLGTFEYSIAYAFTAAVAVAGPFIYIALSRKMHVRTLAAAVLGLLVFSGLAILTIGPLGAVAFFFTCLPFALAESMARPCAYLILLRAAEDTAGSASALINFGMGFFCALATPLASLPIWPNDVFALGMLTLAGGGIALTLVALLAGPLHSDIFDLGEGA